MFATPTDNGNYNSASMSFSLYIVATPVGNLEDITHRAVRILGDVQAVACEDTRQTRKLFSRYKIKNRLLSCHEHNEAQQTEKIIRILKEKGDVALVTDAGTPLLSDPGRRVVARVVEEGFNVVPVPGASALLCALCASGIDFSSGFTFLGFLPRQKGRAVKVLSDFVSSTLPFVIYESPQRVKSVLALLLETLGDRSAAVCREMTKLHEEISRDSLSVLLENFGKRETVKGEIAIVVSGAEKNGGAHDETLIKKRLLELKKQGLSLKDALKALSSEFGTGKNALYDFGLKVWEKE